MGKYSEISKDVWTRKAFRKHIELFYLRRKIDGMIIKDTWTNSNEAEEE
jgi:hypothetical protein